MAVYQHTYNRWRCLAVRRMIDGTHHQHYFPDTDYAAATRLDRKLELEQEIAIAARRREATPTRRVQDHRATGVRGIQISLGRRARSSRVHFRPVFVIGTAATRTRHVPIIAHGLDGAWRMACTIVAEEFDADPEHYIARGERLLGNLIVQRVLNGLDGGVGSDPRRWTWSRPRHADE